MADPLIDSLQDQQEKIVELMAKTADPAQRRQLNELRKQLRGEANRLLELALDRSTAGYRETVEGLEATLGITQEALDDVTAIQKTIDRLTAVVAGVAKLVA